MRVKKFISSLLFAIYIMASCGGMLSVILCHCAHSNHFQAKHSSHYICCHHTCKHCISTTEQQIKSLRCCTCNHDHSTEIDLYNHEQSAAAEISPIVCDILPIMKQVVSTATISSKQRHFCQRKIPLQQSEFVTIKGLRAPPVFA